MKKHQLVWTLPLGIEHNLIEQPCIIMFFVCTEPSIFIKVLLRNTDCCGERRNRVQDWWTWYLILTIFYAEKLFFWTLLSYKLHFMKLWERRCFNTRLLFFPYLITVHWNMTNIRNVSQQFSYVLAEKTNKMSNCFRKYIKTELN